MILKNRKHWYNLFRLFDVFMRYKTLMRFYCATCDPYVKRSCRKAQRENCEKMAHAQAEFDIDVRRELK